MKAGILAVFFIVVSSLGSLAFAQVPTAADLDTLKTQIDNLKADYDKRLQALETQLQALRSQTQAAPKPETRGAPPTTKPLLEAGEKALTPSVHRLTVAIRSRNLTTRWESVCGLTEPWLQSIPQDPN